ncbi:MAG: eight-cysteine-cluster domain-containing protein [Patescibacteria group bacterium]|nr:eight-cysteine-cluster domain-containing protein [Patescibacteria group bacterium]
MNKRILIIVIAAIFLLWVGLMTYLLFWQSGDGDEPSNINEVINNRNTSININNSSSDGTIKTGCAEDSECAIGGCSNEICGLKGMVETITSPCLYREYYQCYALTSCGCVSGQCQWKDNEDFLQCFREKGG